jgi:hypothetical protein
MRKISLQTIWALGILATALVSGCGREQTAAVIPVVVTTVPANGAVAVPIAQVISATFHQAMNPASINSSTFIATGTGGAPVSGTVTYAGTTASFTPSVLLAPTTLYTATITTGATDLLGIPLAANFPCYQVGVNVEFAEVVYQQSKALAGAEMAANHYYRSLFPIDNSAFRLELFCSSYLRNLPDLA